MKKAFTLAEVLLTLAIIGVVASLTIPSVITKVTQDQYVVALRKAFNTLKAVEREAIQEHGEIKNWTFIGAAADDYGADFEKYFKEYFDISKDCGTGPDEGCFAGKYCQIFDKDNCFASSVFIRTYKFMTVDGISYAYSPAHENLIKGFIRVDVNGPKGPNIQGRDMFNFYLFENELGIKPDGSYRTNGQVVANDAMKNYCTTQGVSCTAYVLSEGQMSY